jgi:hypothetical protein
MGQILRLVLGSLILLTITGEPGRAAALFRNRDDMDGTSYHKLMQINLRTFGANTKPRLMSLRLFIQT